MTADFRRLTAWYARVKRPMPWRLAPGPYVCWLSEIMLQQTTYEQALPYYTRFLERFPDVAALAAADVQDVLKAWEGLGYYARARNLHRAARRIAAEGWPKGTDAWRTLPGVGPYTAAALASVLDGEREPVVDGNVARVFARYWALEDDFRKLPPREALADRLRPHMAGRIVPGDFNQAMMELGALVCTPRNPSCATCPLAANCAACHAGDPEAYPRRALRKAVPVRKHRVAVIRDAAGKVLLVKNEEGGLLKGLWDLPVLDAAGEHVQAFSHFRLELEVLVARGTACFADPAEVPLTTAARKVLAKCSPRA